MTKKTDKIKIAVSEKRVKLHVFEPSQRELWTVVGKEKEYWLDPTVDFCSCQAYYFGRLDGKKGCYHLESIKIAKQEKKFELIKFSDDEFEDFISSLVSDL